MYGAGTTVFAVWGYVIANTVDSRVELNPKLLASVLGTTPEAIADAIDALCKPDPLSRNGAAEGRRLQQEGTFQYRVTSHEIYRAMRNEEERREYNRLKQRESRAKRAVKRNVNDGQQMSALSAHTEAEADTETNTDRGSSNTCDPNKQPANPQQMPPQPLQKPNGRSKHPIFQGQRFVVFDWMLEDIGRILGTHLNDFDIDAWFYTLDARAVKEKAVKAKDAWWPWLQAELVLEASKRGLSGTPAHDRAIKEAAENAEVLRLVKESDARAAKGIGR